MDNYVTVVFDSDEGAYQGLHELWKLDDQGDITVHGAAVLRRDRFGRIDVATHTNDIGLRTIAGAGIGALLGAIAGPVGSAMGIAGASAIAAGSAAGLGAAAGGSAGMFAEAGKGIEREEAGYESQFTIRPGQAAVVAEVSEEWYTPVNQAMSKLGGVVYRRTKNAVKHSSFFGDDYTDYLYPYDYEPAFA